MDNEKILKFYREGKKMYVDVKYELRFRVFMSSFGLFFGKDIMKVSLSVFGNFF